MTDIVKHLRAHAFSNRHMTEAADEIERLRTEVEVQAYWGLRWEKAHAELAASQAREAQLRYALSYATRRLGTDGNDPVVVASLALPSDHTALKERLAQERERFLDHVETAWYAQGLDLHGASISGFIDALLNLGDEA